MSFELFLEKIASLLPQMAPTQLAIYTWVINNSLNSFVTFLPALYLCWAKQVYVLL